ncbi:MAG: hypothetical protein Q7U57_03965 [Methylovulum sp.]|nr:hypothetical protein [Methylovulum sp.]
METTSVQKADILHYGGGKYWYETVLKTLGMAYPPGLTNGYV